MKNINQLNLMDKKYIIFDLDGTLIDSIGVWNRIDQLLIEKFANVTIDLSEIQLDRDTFLIKNQSTDIYLAYCDYLINKYRFSWKNAKEVLDIRWELSGMVLQNEMDFKPDVVSLIFKLKQLGFKLILATMTTQVQLDIYTKTNKKMISQMNINEIFDLITRKEDVENKKPHPEIYNRIMQYYSATPEECLVVEDSYTGVLAACNAGIEVINIYDKYANADREKINEIASYSILNYKQLIDFIDSLNFNQSVDCQDTKVKAKI